MPTPLVSILVPVYNVEPYLHECLESILHQTYTRIEVILVDDGATDASGSICDVYAQQDARVSVIHQENQGLSRTRNVLLDAAIGDYVTFIDSDDCVAPTYVEYLLQLALSSPAPLSICGHTTIPARTAAPESDRGELVMTSREALLAYGGERNVQLCVVWGKLYSRAMLSGLRFPPNRVHEDQFFSFLVLDRADRVVIGSERLYRYRSRTDSIMGRRYSHRAQVDAIDAYLVQVEFFHDRGMRAQEERCFRRAFGKYFALMGRTSVEMTSDAAGAELSALRERFRGALRQSCQSIPRKAYYSILIAFPILARRLARMRSSSYMKDGLASRANS